MRHYISYQTPGNKSSIFSFSSIVFVAFRAIFFFVPKDAGNQICLLRFPLIYLRAARSFAAVSVFFISIEMVIGPTPPEQELNIQRLPLHFQNPHHHKVSVLISIHAHINDNSSRLYHICLDKFGDSDCCNQNIRPAADLRQVLRPGMADGDGSILYEASALPLAFQQCWNAQ